MRVRGVVAVGLAGLALAACGGGGSDVDQVRQTAHQFVNDLLNGDTAGACSLITPSALSQVGGQSGCSKLLDLALKTPGAKQKIQTQASKLDSAPVKINGNSATIQGGGSSPTPLVKQNGRWYISGGFSGGG